MWKSLKIQDYIDALSEYLPRKDMDIFEIIGLIEDDDTVVPTFNIRRKKTSKYYTTYCSPEAVKAINAHILSRTDNVTNESKLFKMAVSYFPVNFQKINNDLGLGKLQPFQKPYAEEIPCISLDDVNDLQKKSKNRTFEIRIHRAPAGSNHKYGC